MTLTLFGELVQAGTKALGGERFSLVTLMPAASLVALLWLLWESGLYTIGDVQWPTSLQAVTENVGTAVLAIFAIFLLAVLLRPFQVGLVWMLEGYWDRLPVLRRVAPVAVERHRRVIHTATVVKDTEPTDIPSCLDLSKVAEFRRRQRYLSARRARSAALVARYPRPRVNVSPNESVTHYDDRLMPTVLGNVLREAEDTAGDRYGLDLPAIAPRLYPFIQDRIGTAINRSLDAIQFGAAFVVTFVATAAAAGPLIVLRDDAWRLTPLVAAALAALAYRGTIRTARGHGRLLATAVDLYRFDMVAGMHYPLPRTVEEEFDFNGELSRFLGTREPARRMMHDVPYTHGDPMTPSIQPDTGVTPPSAGGTSPGTTGDSGTGASADPSGPA